MILTVGEILFDIFKNNKRLGGAPFNFFFHLHSFGLPAMFISRIGRDKYGNEILQMLKENKINTEYIQMDPFHKTGQVLVEINDKGIPRYNIIKNVAYDHLSYQNKLDSIIKKDIDMIYMGTLIQRTSNGFNTISKIHENKNNNSKFLYDINLREDCYSEDIIKTSLTHCNILKLNEEELTLLKQLFKNNNKDKYFLDFLINDFCIEWICLTRGDKGSELFTAEKNYSIKINKKQPVVDTVGAGDAYASILAIGYLNKWEPNLILRRATEFAGAICTINGAVPDNKKFYNNYSKWFQKYSDFD